MSLSTFLAAHKKGPKEVQTHTWFASGKDRDKVVTLHIPDEDVPTLRRLLVAEVKRLKPGECGANSVSEKIAKGTPFRHVADLDFNVADIQRWGHDNGYTNADILRERLVEKLRSIVSLYRSTVVDLTNKPCEDMVLATRLPYKIHLHFPSVIVDAKGAKVIGSVFSDRFKAAYPDLWNASVNDTSVYTTGLRMLYCHKGGMSNSIKRQAESRAHENLFSRGSYSDVYHVTDLVTWTQDAMPIVAHLEQTSVQVDKNHPIPSLLASSSIKGKRSRSAASVGGTVRPTFSDEGRATECTPLIQFLSDTFSISLEEIRNDEQSLRGGKLAIPTRCRQCPFAKREHNSNQLYFVVSREHVELRCHDDDCSERHKVVLPRGLVSDVSRLIQIQKDDDEIETIVPVASSSGQQRSGSTDEDRLNAFRGILSQPIGNKTDIARMNLTSADERMTSMGYWTCTLPQNRYCPVCRSTHDRPENFMQIGPLGNRGIGCNLRHGEFYPDPPAFIPSSAVNILFSTINLNVTNTNEVEVRDFGRYDGFPHIHSDETANRLCHASLSGRTRSVALYTYHLMQGHYVYQDKQWYKFNGRYWRRRPGPDDLLVGEVSEIYENLQQHYAEAKQVKWLGQLIDELGNVPRRKAFMEDMERLVLEQDERLPLDEQTNLLGFQNGVFDSETGQMREHRAEDYLTDLLPYDVPNEPDADIEQEINDFFEGIMPIEDERKFLWVMLALHLTGSNSHSIAMVWSGSGGNGKSVLTHLMKNTFAQTFDEQPATYLTSERPSPEKPSPLMVSQRLKRCVIASEPEAGKKCNTSFIKFITGNDLVKVRNNHSNDFVEYYPRFIVSMLCNEIPLFDGVAGEIRGLWRRLKIFKFRMEFTANPTLPHHRQEDTTLPKKMLRWPPHFMRMLIRVYQDYLSKDRKFVVPQGVEDNIEEQREENNPMDAWLAENLVVKEGARIHYHRFDKAYRLWQVAHQKNDRMPRSGFMDKLISLGHTVSAPKSLQRDSGCCSAPHRYVLGVDVRDWDTFVFSD